MRTSSTTATVVLCLALGLGLLAAGSEVDGAVVLGTGTGALLGNDLTDVGNDGVPGSYALPNYAGFDAEFFSTDEAGFGGGEFSFNVFDNSISSGSNKWCCNGVGGDGHQLDARILAGSHILTHFTFATSNDTPARDPQTWSIEGSNDGVSFTPIFSHSGSSLFGSARNTVWRFDGGGVDFATPAAYSWFRYNVTATGGGNHAVGEIEYFGIANDGTLRSITSGAWDNPSTWIGAPPPIPTSMTETIVENGRTVDVNTPSVAGTLALNNGGVQIFSTLDVSGNVDATLGAVLVGPSGVLTVGGDLNVAAAGGSLVMQAGARVVANGAGTVANTYLHGNSTFDGTGNLTITGLDDQGIAGTLTKQGPGSVTLDGTGTLLAGATTFHVTDGTLGAIGSLGGAPGVTLDGGTLEVTGDITAVTGATSVRVVQNVNAPLNMAEVQVFETGTNANVAILGTATQSSTGSGGVPTRGNDGNTDGNWGGGSVQHTGSGVGQWWQVELPSVTDLDAVHVWSRTDCCWDRVDDFNLIVSDAVGDQIYNQRITGVGSGAGRNRLISLSAIDAVVMTTPITVVSDSGLSAVSDSTATFTDVTLNNGTALATSGADTIFSGLTLAGASGTLAPTNHLAVTGYNDGGAAKTLIMGGTGTLLIDNAASGISAAATTFEAASGRLEANGPNALGGSTSLTISGGTAAFGDHVGPPTIASGALGAWTFDSGTAADTSGSFNNGIAGGSLTYEADTPLGVGQSLQSHSGGGAGNVLTVPNSASLQSIDDSLSLAYWMKSNTGDNGNWVRLFQKGTEANGDRSWMVNRYNNGNEVNVRVDTTGGFNQNIARGGPQPFDGEWHHVTFTFDSGTWNKYFDGEQVGTGGYNHGDGLTNTRDLYIFGRNAAGHYVGSLDDIYLYDRALSSTEVRDLVHTLTAPDMSAVNVSVTAPSSTLEVNSIAPATFNSLTMANGTDLTTTGNVAGITFKQTTLPGGTATFKPEVPTTLTGTTGLANPGSASRLVAAGSSDLIINKAPTGSMANVTHEAKSGRMVLDYVGGDPTGGAPLVATGGTFTMQGAPGLLSNQLEYAFYDNASNTTLAAIDDGTDGNGQNGGLFALTPSNQSAWPSQVRGKSSWTDEVWQGGNISNSYAQMWSGKVTVPADGTYQVRVHGDDHEMFWLDVNQDGEFNTGTDDITRNVPPEGWNAAKTGSVTLAAGQTYDFAIAHYEGGGGDFVQVEITPPAALGMPTFRINPSDPDQNGLWSRSGITALDIQNTLTVDNVPADGFGMSGFMIGGRNDSNLDFAGGGGLLSETPVGSTLFDGLLDINGDGAFRALIPEITRNDDYQSLFTGTLTVDPASAGNHRFEMANKDDRTVIWVDLDQDGAFSHTGTAGDEQMFGLNNGNRTVNLAAGEYAVAMGHMEHGGGSRIRALIQTPAFGNRVIDPSDPAQAGLWSTTPTSTLELITDVDANLRELVLKNGDLRITGGNHLSVEQASISPTSSANVGLITDTDTLLTGNTGFTGNGRTATFTKAGDATLTLDKPGTGLGDVTWKVTQGTLAVSGDNPLGPDGSNVNLAGGIFQVTGAVTAGAVTRDPTAHWAFDETTGTTAADSTGTYNGSLQGDPVWQPAGGVAGGALLLDGNGDHVLIPGGANRIDIDNKSYSLAFWANRDSTDGDYVIGQGDNGNTRSSLHVGFRDNNTFTNAVWGDDLNFDSATVTDTADWHHWVATYDADGNRQEIWMDGQLVAGRGTGGDFQSNGSNDFWIGRRRDGNNFAGLLDEVYVFDGVLGSDEVQSLFANSHIGAIDMTDTNFRVTADSTLNAETALTAAFGNVTFEAGTLNVVGAPGGVSFTGGGIAAGAIASGINNSADVTINGPFDGNNATATFTKTGAGALILPQGTVNHGGVSVNANGGRIVSGGAMQAANLTIGGGGNVDTGVNDVTIGDGGAFSAGSMKISGSGSPFTVGGDNMAAGPQRLGLTGGTVTINGGGMPGGVQLWVDASDIDADGNPGNNPADGANITVWKDKTGLGGRDFDGRASDPSYRTSGPDLPNGNPVVYFDGNDELWTTFDLDFVSEYSIFSVARYAGSGNSDGQSRRVIDSRDHNWLFGYHGALDERFYAEGWIHTTGSDNTDWHLHTGTMNDDPDPKASFWKEGNLLTSNDTGSNNTNYKPGQLRFGGRGSENSNSEVAELLVFDHLLTADELNSVGGYLAAKYGINAPNYTGNIDPPPIDLPDTDVNVSANSTLHADTALTATFGNLDMAAGVDLTLTGADAGFSFNNVSGGHSVDRGMTVRGGIAPGVGVESDFGVGGNLVFDDTAGANTYDWDLGPDADDDGIGQYDTVRVSGDLTLGDWTLALHDLGGEAAEWDPLALFTGFSGVTWDPNAVSFDMTDAPAWLEFTQPEDLRVEHLLAGAQGPEGLYLLGLQTVPEPGSIVLMLLGGLGLIAVARRRRK